MTSNQHTRGLVDFLGRNRWFCLVTGLAALALRLFFVFRFPAVVDDSRLYGNIAENWLHHGVYGITNSGQIVPTLSRLPGYPAFLAAIFAVFGVDNFRAVLLIQVLFDLGTCILIADLARRLFDHQIFNQQIFNRRTFSERSGRAAFALAGLCPFLANYAAAALTETLEIFFTTLALDLAIVGLSIPDNAGGESSGGSETSGAAVLVWLACGLSTGACILLRPDGGILLAAILLFLFFVFAAPILRSRNETKNLRLRPLILSATSVACFALLPLLPWTLRNLYAFHQFQPLAPRYANDSDEPVMSGFNRWTKTWIAEYTSVQEIYWNVPGENIDFSRLPRRAFDLPEQQRETADLFAEYNESHDVTPEMDARFAALASQRIHAAPLRYYLWLPALRVADMWLRPRTELLPSDPRWWEFNDEPVWLTVSIVFGIVNLFYVIAGVFGLISYRYLPGIRLLFVFLLLRSVFLGTLENPEPRYTLECYPVVIIAAAALLMHKTRANDRKPA